MYLAVQQVKSGADYTLLLTFENGEKRCFDMKPYLETGVFQELKELSKFNKVRVSFDTIEWENEIDLDPEILYNYSIKI